MSVDAQALFPMPAGDPDLLDLLLEGPVVTVAPAR
jgi:hypothetical protein